jgi:hypothetical protein
VEIPTAVSDLLAVERSGYVLQEQHAIGGRQRLRGVEHRVKLTVR